MMEINDEYARELQARDLLEEVRRVRDDWRLEYLNVRDELKPQLNRIEEMLTQIALGLGIRA